jgi:hypothetical protein
MILWFYRGDGRLCLNTGYYLTASCLLASKILSAAIKVKRGPMVGNFSKNDLTER